MSEKIRKAGKGHGPYTRPPAQSTRTEIINNTLSWLEDHKRKAHTPNIKESVESLVPGYAPIKLQIIPGLLRFDLQRATRRTGLGRRGQYVHELRHEPAGANDKLCYDRV